MIMKHRQCNIWFPALCAFILFLVWLCGMAETTMWVSYRNWMTAGEIFAFVTANKYESSDVLNYCLRYVWPYWVVCSLIYFGIGILVWRLSMKINSRTSRYAAIGIIVVMAAPFVLLGVTSSLLHEILCVVRQVNNIKNYQNDNADFEYHAYRDSVDSNEVYVLSIGESVRYKNLSLNGSYTRNTMPLL